jgi:hypothetical protein
VAADRSYRLLYLLFAYLILPAFLGCQNPAPTVTTIAIGPTLHTQVERLGINLSGQTYYDSGQMLRNFTYRNPGFEGGTWQSILHCKTVTPTSCTDENPWTIWPTDFLRHAVYDILPNGPSGIVISSTAAASASKGITVELLGPAPEKGSFIRVRIDKPGDAQAGWWTEAKGGATLSTEFLDLSPNTPGKQALRIEASGSAQTATVKAFIDTYNNRSFLQLRGRYTLSFRAKSLSINRNINVKVTRLETENGNHSFLNKTLPLAANWRDYTYDFTAAEDGSALGPIELSFEFAGSSALLDDVSLTEAAAPENPTAFRDAVVRTLRELHPGVLRYMDNGTSFGSSLDNLLASPLARVRAGSSTQQTLQEDDAIGIPDFLVLCQAVGADPWISLPPGLSPGEARALIEYLEPWTRVFRTIHLELGNEQWNARSFGGSTIQDAKAYGQRAAVVFAAARSSAAFKPASYDLILGSWATVPWWTMTELAATSGQDSVAVAPYLFNVFNDASSTDAIFGPMFAQPEQVDSRPGGYMAQQLVEAGKAHTRLAVYEVNLGTASGSASQGELDSTVPSLGAGIAVADHMLLMLRDLGITTQCLFSLPEYGNGFSSTTGRKEDMPLWGAVVDMGGPTNLRRPQFLALQLANSAILSTMLSTHVAGPSHSWNQPLSSNDKIELEGVHELQTFAFAAGNRRSLILLNLSRTETIPVQFARAQSPAGAVQESRLNSANLTDSNEIRETVKVTKSRISAFDPATPYSLPPHSMTTLSWSIVH